MDRQEFKAGLAGAGKLQLSHHLSYSSSNPGSTLIICLSHHIPKYLIFFEPSVLFIYITILKEKLKLLANMNIVLLSFSHLMLLVFLEPWVLPFSEGRLEGLETADLSPSK